MGSRSVTESVVVDVINQTLFFHQAFKPIQVLIIYGKCTKFVRKLVYCKTGFNCVVKALRFCNFDCKLCYCVCVYTCAYHVTHDCIPIIASLKKTTVCGIIIC